MPGQVRPDEQRESESKSRSLNIRALQSESGVRLQSSCSIAFYGGILALRFFLLPWSIANPSVKDPVRSHADLMFAS